VYRSWAVFSHCSLHISIKGINGVGQVFVGSPGDVAAERKRAFDIIESINRDVLLPPDTYTENGAGPEPTGSLFLANRVPYPSRKTDQADRRGSLVRRQIMASRLTPTARGFHYVHNRLLFAYQVAASGPWATDATRELRSAMVIRQAAKRVANPSSRREDANER